MDSLFFLKKKNKMEIKLIVKNTIELWLIMTALILPFPYAIIPSIKFAASESSLIYLLSFTLIILSCIVNVLLLFFNFFDKIRCRQIISKSILLARTKHSPYSNRTPYKRYCVLDINEHLILLQYIHWVHRNLLRTFTLF